MKALLKPHGRHHRRTPLQQADLTQVFEDLKLIAPLVLFVLLPLIAAVAGAR